jgi:short-subunit dehydrogenase involved in D-alanine esterification of teichoic acids
VTKNLVKCQENGYFCTSINLTNKLLNKKKMKKVFFVFAVAAGLAMTACNNKPAGDAAATADSTSIKAAADSAAAAAMKAAAPAVDSTVNAAVDSAADKAKGAMDKAADKAKDAMKK